jgi:hypothetical protein
MVLILTAYRAMTVCSGENSRHMLVVVSTLRRLCESHAIQAP